MGGDQWFGSHAEEQDRHHLHLLVLKHGRWEKGLSPLAEESLGDLLVHGTALNQRSHTGRGNECLFLLQLVDTSHPCLLYRQPSERQTQMLIFFLMFLRGLFTLDCAAKCVMLCYFCFCACLSHSSLGGALGIGGGSCWLPGEVPSRVSCLWRESVRRLGFTLSLDCSPFPARR